MAALGPGLQERDLDEEAPELRRAVDPEIARRAAAEERPEDGLDDVLTVKPAGEPAAQVDLSDPGQAAGILREQFVGAAGVAVANPPDQLGGRIGF